MRRAAKRVVRRVLGEALYSDLRQWLRQVLRIGRGSPAHEADVKSISGFDLGARFKSYVVQSHSRRRALERELAELRYPELYKSELGVVAEVSRTGELPSPWSGSVSVIITNFNYGHYVTQAIDSVLNQTHRPIELMVVDDASSDCSSDKLLTVLGQVSSVPWQLVRLKHNIGLPAARNLGIRLARGEFIFMLDADNHLLPQCIESHLREAEASKADATYGMIRTFGSVSTLLSDGQFSAERLAEGPYIDAMAMFRRSVLLDLGLYATDSALYGWEDYELWVRLAARERRVAFIPAVLSHYRFHQQNMISIASLDTRAAWTYLFASYPEIFGKMSADEKDREVERRAWWIAESGKATLRPEGPEVGCGCGDRGSS